MGQGSFQKVGLEDTLDLGAASSGSGLLFIFLGWAEFVDEIVDILRNSVGVPRLAGCFANGVISNQWEFEQKGGITIGLFHLPGSRIESLSFPPDNSKRRPVVARPTIGGD